MQKKIFLILCSLSILILLVGIFMFTIKQKQVNKTLNTSQENVIPVTNTNVTTSTPVDLSGKIECLFDEQRGIVERDCVRIDRTELVSNDKFSTSTIPDVYGWYLYHDFKYNFTVEYKHRFVVAQSNYKAVGQKDDEAVHNVGFSESDGYWVMGITVRPTKYKSIAELIKDQNKYLTDVGKVSIKRVVKIQNSDAATITHKVVIDGGENSDVLDDQESLFIIHKDMLYTVNYRNFKHQSDDEFYHVVDSFKFLK